MSQTAEEIYQQYVKPLPNDEKLRLIVKVSSDLMTTETKHEKRSLLELEGLGAKIWKDVDVEEYINEMRDEWDNRPQ